MDLFRYIVRFLYKIRWYLIILPLIALIVAWFMTRNMDRVYDTNTTIYTGMITGYNIRMRPFMKSPFAYLHVA